MATAAIAEDRRLLLQADLAEPGAAADLWERAVAWRGRIDVLVNNAAVMPQAGIDESDEAWANAWDQVLAVNVTSPSELIRRATNHFVEAGGGVLITMSSWAAQRGLGQFEARCVRCIEGIHRCGHQDHGQGVCA